MRTTLAGIALLLATLAGTAARGQTAPATFPSIYTPLYCGRGVMVDGYRDQSGAVDDRDLVGNVLAPAGFRAVDDQFLYFRLRLDGSPMQGNGLTQFAWGVELSTDGDPTDYEILIGVDGASETVRVYSNTTTTVPDSPADPADQLLTTYPFAENGQLVDAGPSLDGGGNDTYLDWAVPWSDLAGLGLDRGTLVHLWAASSTNPDRLDGDFACHDGGGGSGIPSLSRDTPAPIAPDPTRGPGPVGGPDGGAGGSADGGGNVVGPSGIEGGPGCDCGVPGRGAPPLRALVVFALLGAAIVRVRRRS